MVGMNRASVMLRHDDLPYIHRHNHTRFERQSNQRIEMESTGRVFNASPLIDWFVNLFTVKT